MYASVQLLKSVVLGYSAILYQEQRRYEEAIDSYKMAIQCRPRLTSKYVLVQHLSWSTGVVTDCGRSSSSSLLFLVNLACFKGLFMNFSIPFVVATSYALYQLHWFHIFLQRFSMFSLVFPSAYALHCQTPWIHSLLYVFEPFQVVCYANVFSVATTPITTSSISDFWMAQNGLLCAAVPLRT